MSRKKLPLRKNCEGYFTNSEGKILAKDSKKGYVIFPGGGVEDDELPEEGLLRETYEETGAIIRGKLKKLGTLRIIWDETWAKTKKQKERYKKYSGDEMHFFYGRIKRLEEPTGDPKNLKENDLWKGQKLTTINEVIKIIKTNKQNQTGNEEYHDLQLKFLSKIRS